MHVPATVALLAALVVHILSVFLYWSAATFACTGSASASRSGRSSVTGIWAPAPSAWAAAPTATSNCPTCRPGCTVCHTEHEGPTLRNNPATSGCAGCHSALDSKLPGTRLLNAADWHRDHPQFRPALVRGFDGRTPRLERVSLDERPRDLGGLAFSHAQHLSRDNAVARMTGRLAAYGKPLGCADCHWFHPASRAPGFAALERQARGIAQKR